MAHELQVDVSEVIQGGFGLAFIAYPSAIVSLQGWYRRQSHVRSVFTKNNSSNNS